MAYNKAEIIELAIKKIEEMSIRKVSHLIAFLPISRSTFYEWELDKSDELIQKVNNEKIKRKVKMLDSWQDSGNAALEIAAFKLIADDDEIEALSTSRVKQDNTHDFKNKPTIILDFGEEDKGN